MLMGLDGPTPTNLKDRGVKHIRIWEAQKIYEIYEFKEQIGHGSFGIVVAAIEKSNNKEWAIKIVHKNIAGASKLVEVEREIKILKVVNHPNIIYLDRIYESHRKIYMVLERCKEELYQIYLKKRPFSEKVGKKILSQLIGAISYLHKNDIVHRDVKMENILIAGNPADPTDEYFIKLTDFGLSIVKSGVGLQSLMKEYCGTIAYMPPEILQMKSYSELCDVWAVGVILYMMLFARLPFCGTSEEEIKAKICTKEPNFESTNISSNAIDLLKGILEKDPVQRMTAAQIKDHPWLGNRSRGPRKDQNIIDMMKQFRCETKMDSSVLGVKGLSVDDFNEFEEVLTLSTDEVKTE